MVNSSGAGLQCSKVQLDLAIPQFFMELSCSLCPNNVIPFRGEPEITGNSQYYSSQNELVILDPTLKMQVQLMLEVITAHPTICSGYNIISNIPQNASRSNSWHHRVRVCFLQTKETSWLDLR